MSRQSLRTCRQKQKQKCLVKGSWNVFTRALNAPDEWELLNAMKPFSTSLNKSLFYLPGVLRENDPVVPEPAGGEESWALLLQSPVQLVLLFLLVSLLLTVRRKQRAGMTWSRHRHSGVGPQEQEIRVKGTSTLKTNRKQGSNISELSLYPKPCFFSLIKMCGDKFSVEYFFKESNQVKDREVQK